MANEQNNLPETLEVKPRAFSSKKNIMIIALAAIFALSIGGTAVAIGISSLPANRISRYMGAAERYLSEMNYEQAIIEFQRILNIEPMNAEAYIGLANAYLGLDNTDKALETLRRGFEFTGDERLQTLINEIINSGVYKPDAGTSEAVGENNSKYDDDEAIAVREYDSQSRLICEEIQDADGIYTFTEYGEMYDAHDNLTGWGTIYIRKSRFDEYDREIYIYEYDNNYGTICEQFYDENGEILKSIETTYDSIIGYDDTGDPIFGDTVYINTYVNKYEYGNFGAVKVNVTRTSTQTDSVWGENTFSNVFVYLYEYDSFGREISSIKSDKDRVLHRTEWKYDSDNSIIEERYISYNSNGTVHQEMVYTYERNDSGKLLQSEMLNTVEDHVIQRHSIAWKYDETGKAIELTDHTYNDRGGETGDFSEVRTFSDTGWTMHHIGTRNGVFEDFIHTVVYDFDSYGRVTVETKYDEEGNFVGKTISEY